MSSQVCTYQVMRCEWIAEIGYIDQYNNPQTRQPYWTSQPFDGQSEAKAALEAHEEVIGWNDRLHRYEMQKSYTYGNVQFRKTMVDEYDK